MQHGKATSLAAKAFVTYMTLEHVFEPCHMRIQNKSDYGFRNTATLPRILPVDKELLTMQRVTADRKVVYDLLSRNVTAEAATSQVSSKHGSRRRNSIKGPRL